MTVFFFPLCLFQLPDVCYSWWVLASLKIIGRIHWIDKAKLRSFILACQDEETGGFADRPGDMVSSLQHDAVEGWNNVCVGGKYLVSYQHGLSVMKQNRNAWPHLQPWLSLKGSLELSTSPASSVQVDPFHTLFGVAGLSLLGDEQIKPVNPVLCMPEDVLQRLNLQPDLLS